MLAAWGSNAYGQSTIPDGIANGTAGTEARSIAAGDSFSAAALGDGSVIVWGLWQGKQQVVRYYIGLTLGVPVNLIQVVAGDAHIVVRAQAPDGLFVFGDNTNGQTNVPKALVYPQSPGLISSLMSGPKHSAALLSDGSLLIWGCKAYDFGQCKRPDPCLENNGGCSTLATCTSELGMAKCTCLPRHIGDGRTCLLASTPQFTQVVARSTYSLVLMSDGTVKGFGKWITGVEVRVPITVRNAVKIAGGPRHALALMPGGLVRGLSGGGATPIPVGLADVVDISVGSGFSVALLKDSSVKVWGLLRAEQSPVNGLKNVAQVSAGHDHVLALMKDGSVKAFGFFLGDPSGKVTVPKNLTKAIQVAAGYDHSLVLQVDGTVVAFGGDEFGQRLVPFGLSNVVQIVAGEKRSAALLANGKVMAWGADDVAQSTAIDNSDANNVKHIAIGVSHALGLLGDGSVRVFCGKNDQGQCNLPDPCTENRGGCSKDAHCQPRYGVAACVCKLGYAGDGKTCVADPKAKLEQVVAGFGSTAVRFADGTVRAFGRYFTDVPLDLDDAAHLEAGPGYYVAVTRSGKLRAWGGRDGTANMYLPVGLTGVKTTSATTAILEDGRIIAWGQNSKDLTPPSWLVPSSVAQLSSSGIHTLALLKDGSVKGWGNAVLTGAEGIRGLTMVSASTTHNLALSDDGRVVAFGGYNFYGERNVPYDVVDVKQVEAGSGYSLVVLKDGTVRGWGLNATGQIGIPKGLKNVQRVSAGDRHAVALLEDGTIVAWGQNAEVPADLAPDYF